MSGGGGAHTLLIPLVGPMQAWGSRSRFDDRDTHPEPTKSGVIGLICAAMGRGREADLSDLNALRFGVRVDAPGRAETDYHTAQDVMRASGSGGAAVTSRRHYLADARFLVGLSGDDLKLLLYIEGHLKNPFWTLSLGRKSFPLSVPPYLPQGSVRENVGLEQALKDEPWRALRRREERPKQLRMIIETPEGDAVQSDLPLSFAWDNRAFGLRRFTAYPVTLPPVENNKENLWIP